MTWAKIVLTAIIGFQAIGLFSQLVGKPLPPLKADETSRQKIAGLALGLLMLAALVGMWQG